VRAAPRSSRYWRPRDHYSRASRPGPRSTACAARAPQRRTARIGGVGGEVAENKLRFRCGPICSGPERRYSRAGLGQRPEDGPCVAGVARGAARDVGIMEPRARRGRILRSARPRGAVVDLGLDHAARSRVSRGCAHRRCCSRRARLRRPRRGRRARCAVECSGGERCLIDASFWVG